jgi:hypothetical protein
MNHQPGSLAKLFLYIAVVAIPGCSQNHRDVLAEARATRFAEIDSNFVEAIKEINQSEDAAYSKGV